MVEIPKVCWTVLDEKIFLRGVMDRFQHRSTSDRFGAPRVFVERYLVGLNQRCMDFSGTEVLDGADRAEIRTYAKELLDEATTEGATDRMLGSAE